MGGQETRFRPEEKRGRYALMTVKKRLINSRLAKTTQAMIIQAVVESTMTFNCEIRAWQMKEIRERCKK